MRGWRKFGIRRRNLVMLMRDCLKGPIKYSKGSYGRNARCMSFGRCIDPWIAQLARDFDCGVQSREGQRERNKLKTRVSSVSSGNIQPSRSDCQGPCGNRNCHGCRPLPRRSKWGNSGMSWGAQTAYMIAGAPWTCLWFAELEKSGYSQAAAPA